MDDISQQILTALVEDEGDGFVCIEIIEPYVNANRDNEATYLDILEKIITLSQNDCIEGCERIENDLEEVYVATRICKENFNKLWFKITDKGREMINRI